MTTPPTRVLIADDHALLRDGLRMLINAEDDLEVVGEAADTRAVVAATRETKPDVLLLDLTMPGGGGLEAIDQLRAARLNPHILVLTMHEEPGYLRSALAKGVHGYLVKRVASEQLISAIRTVREGRVYIGATLDGPDTRELLDGDGSNAALRILSPRETEVLRLVANGHTNQRAAELMDISIKTVEGYRARLMRKIDATTRAELVRFAMGCGLMDE